VTVVPTESGRDSRVTTVQDVAAQINDGMTVGIGGFINSGHPMAFVRQMIADGRKDLTVVGAASAGLEVDLLIGARIVRKIVAPYVGAEGLASIGPCFRKAAQEDLVEVYEIDEAQYYAGLRASAQCLPFNPWRAGIGTAYPTVNPALKPFSDPISGEPLLAIPAIELDVCLLHAAISDRFGNVQHNGTGYGDSALSAAANLTFVSVETIVPTESIRSSPRATSIPGADGVVRVPFGAHPFSADGYYRPDAEHLRRYLLAAHDWLRTGSRSELDRYIDQYVRGPADHWAYLEQIGLRRVLDLPEYE
jgi:glutaconate CoA-transferase, subunit A